MTAWSVALKAPSPEAMVGLPPAMLTVVALWPRGRP
jgi:hypothetical protein